MILVFAFPKCYSELETNLSLPPQRHSNTSLSTLLHPLVLGSGTLIGESYDGFSSLHILVRRINLYRGVSGLHLLGLVQIDREFQLGNWRSCHPGR